MVGQLNDRVLLVEDAPLLRKIISAYLVSAGYVVRVAVDGLDAIAKLRTGLPDLIISDLNMPRMSGFELLHIVRKRFPQIPVIVLSAAFDEMPLGLAADGYFRKGGFAFDQLLEIMTGLASKPPRRAPLPHFDSQPVQAKWDGNGHYTLDCEDCLRVFTVLRAPYLGRHDKWTTCVHCGRVVQFRVADLDPKLLVRPQFQVASARAF